MSLDEGRTGAAEERRSAAIPAPDSRDRGAEPDPWGAETVRLDGTPGGLDSRRLSVVRDAGFRWRPPRIVALAALAVAGLALVGVALGSGGGALPRKLGPAAASDAATAVAQDRSSIPLRPTPAHPAKRRRRGGDHRRFRRSHRSQRALRSASVTRVPQALPTATSPAPPPAPEAPPSEATASPAPAPTPPETSAPSEETSSGAQLNREFGFER
jgi:hypothetical protein